MSEASLTMESIEQLHALFGDLDCNVNTIQKAFGVTVFSRGSDVKITGADENSVNAAKRCLESLSKMYFKGDPINDQNVRYVISLVNDGTESQADTISSDCVCVSYAGKPIRPKTLGQKKYCEMIRKNTITFGVGPAGTGKTYLAVALAVSAFKAHEVQRIILTRPAVEAGEKLGFLPGDLQNKVDPYLRPLYDALFEMFGQEAFAKLQERGVIEVAPLAYMRGRTHSGQCQTSHACADVHSIHDGIQDAYELSQHGGNRQPQHQWEYRILAQIICMSHLKSQNPFPAKWYDQTHPVCSSSPCQKVLSYRPGQ